MEKSGNFAVWKSGNHVIWAVICKRNGQVKCTTVRPTLKKRTKNVSKFIAGDKTFLSAFGNTCHIICQHGNIAFEMCFEVSSEALGPHCLGVTTLLEITQKQHYINVINNCRVKTIDIVSSHTLLVFVYCCLSAVVLAALFPNTQTSNLWLYSVYTSVTSCIS